MQTTFKEQIDAIRFARVYLGYRADLMDQTGVDASELRKQDQALNDATSTIFAFSIQDATEQKDMSQPLAIMDAIHESATVTSENAEITIAKSNESPFNTVQLPILHVEGYELRRDLMRNHVDLYSKLLMLSRKHRVKISRVATEGKLHDFYRLRLEVGNRVFFEDEDKFEPYKAYDRLLESISKL